MKKHVLLFVAALATLSLQAQVKVASNGNMSIQGNDSTPLSALSIGSAGDSNYKVYVESDKNGVYVQRKGQALLGFGISAISYNEGSSFSYGLNGKAISESATVIGASTNRAIDEYGNMERIQTLGTLLINDNEVWDWDFFHYVSPIIENGGQLTLSADDIRFYKDVSILVHNGGTLIIDGCRVTQADIHVERGGNLIIKNNAALILADDDSLLIEKGANMEISNSQILNLKDL